MKIIIDDILNNKHKTRYWLSQQTGITYVSIKKLCDNNTESIKFSMIEKICTALECDVSDIMKLEKCVK